MEKFYKKFFYHYLMIAIIYTGNLD